MTSAATRSGSEARVTSRTLTANVWIASAGLAVRHGRSLLDLDRGVGRPADGDRFSLLDVEIGRLILEALSYGCKSVRDCPGSDRSKDKRREDALCLHRASYLRQRKLDQVRIA